MKQKKGRGGSEVWVGVKAECSQRGEEDSGTGYGVRPVMVCEEVVVGSEGVMVKEEVDQEE